MPECNTSKMKKRKKKIRSTRELTNFIHSQSTERASSFRFFYSSTSTTQGNKATINSPEIFLLSLYSRSCEDFYRRANPENRERFEDALLNLHDAAVGQQRAPYYSLQLPNSSPAAAFSFFSPCLAYTLMMLLSCCSFILCTVRSVSRLKLLDDGVVPRILGTRVFDDTKLAIAVAELNFLFFLFNYERREKHLIYLYAMHGYFYRKREMIEKYESSEVHLFTVHARRANCWGALL